MYKRNYLFVFAAVLFFAGCKKADEYPIEPVIEFKSLTTDKNPQGYDTEGIVEISFTDGDGDIGILNSEVDNPPFVGDEYKFDVHIHYFYKNTSGVWIYDSGNNDEGWISVILTPEGNKKGIRGDILKRVDLPFGVSNLHIRFEVYIYDRALHKSNVITTPEIVISVL